MSPQEEAANILREVVSEMASGQVFDTVAMLRRCQHACELAGMETARNWFARELGGYPQGVPVEPFRHLSGRFRVAINQAI